MKESIAICIVNNNLYFESRYAIENLIEKTKLKFKLYIFDNGSTDNRIKEFSTILCEKKKGLYIFSETAIPLPKAINFLLKQVQEKYCVIFPINYLVHANWLEDLISSYKIIDNAGCFSIRNTTEKLHLVPILHRSATSFEDKLNNVYLSETNAVEGLLMFDKQLLDEKIGLMNENFRNNGYEELEFAFRFSGQGFNNVYIRKQTAIKLNLQNEILFPKKTKDGFLELKEEVKNMVKSQNFKK